MFRLLCIALACATFPAQAAEPALKIEPYPFELADGTQLAAERGTFWVPEQRSNPKSRKIAIGFVRFKSTSATPGEPLVYLAGGPGGSGVATAKGPRQPVFLALRQYGDVIALDQRGVGLSNHIAPCRASTRFDAALTLSDATLTAYYRSTLAKCVAEWLAAGVAVEGYTTSESADDIEELRRLLGVPKVGLWGISYGTQLALETMRRHPRSVSRAVLASVDGTGQNIKLPLAVEASFRRIEAAMRKPGLVALMRTVHQRLDAEPVAVDFKQPGVATVRMRMDSFPLRMLAGFVPKNPDGIPLLTGAYQALAAGNAAPLAPQLYGFFYKEPLQMTGMAELIDIASGLPPEKRRRIEREIPGSLLGDAINFPVSRLIGVVPELNPSPRYWRTVSSNIPVLVFSGDLDVRTPLEEQSDAIKGLRNRHQVIVRNGGHDLFEAHHDIPRIMVEFFSGRRVFVNEIELPRPNFKPPGK